MTEGKRLSEPHRRSFRRALPSIMGSALRLVWSGSRTRSLLLFATEVVASVSLFAQILVIDHVLRVVLAVGESDEMISRAIGPVALLAALIAASTLAFSLVGLQQRVLGELVARSVWRRILHLTHTINLSTYDDPDFYDQAERVRVSAVTRTQIVVQALVVFVGNALGLVAGTAALISISPALAPLLLLSGLPLLLASRLSGRLEFAFVVKQSQRDRERGYLQAVLTQRDEAKEVRAFALSTGLLRRWEANYRRYLHDLHDHAGRLMRLQAVGHLGAAILTAGAMMLAVYLVARGDLTIAAAGAALVAVRLLGSRVTGSSRGLSSLLESARFLGDLEEFLDREPITAARRSLAESPEGFQRLSVSGVTFTYPGAGRPSLRDVSMEIRRGEVVALVGENGSGKSTLAKLLADLYEPTEGSISWDGVDIRQYDPHSVRRRIAIIFQDFIRYRFTARTNIALGHPDEDVDDEAVRDAARKADADRFLTSLPHGYDTVLSKEYVGGTDLSLGQWQRVALARAFVRDAPFLILDEPSASLDARGEHQLFERIRALFVDRTVLLISHRFSTVRTADRIYVLSDGSVVEEGNHASLMAYGGLYAELFALQADSYLDAEQSSSRKLPSTRRYRAAEDNAT